MKSWWQLAAEALVKNAARLIFKTFHSALKETKICAFIGVRVMVFNPIFNNISAISWRSVLL